MPWTTPETFTAGQTLTAASMNKMTANDLVLPRGFVAYVENTTLSQTASADADVTSLSVTFTAEANRRYRITGVIPYVERSSGIAATIQLQEDGTTIQHWKIDGGAVAIGGGCTLVSYRTGITAALHTYKLRIVRTAGSYGTIIATSNAATGAAFILVEDMGGTV